MNPPIHGDLQNAHHNVLNAQITLHASNVPSGTFSKMEYVTRTMILIRLIVKWRYEFCPNHDECVQCEKDHYLKADGNC